MKKIRLVLSAFAIILAAGATFATKHHTSAVLSGYEYIPASGGDPVVCNSISTTCGNFSGAPCESSGHQVRNSSNINTSCGTQLKFPS